MSSKLNNLTGRRSEAAVVVVGARNVDARSGRGEDGHRRSSDKNRLHQSQPQFESADSVFGLRRFVKDLFYELILISS